MNGPSRGCRTDKNSRESPARLLAKAYPNFRLGEEELAPTCEGPREILLLSNATNARNWISPDGQLYSYKYSEKRPLQEFCVDTLNGKLAALVCSPCTRETCVQLCCPHGQAKKEDKTYIVKEPDHCGVTEDIPLVCQPHEDEVPWAPVWEEEEEEPEVAQKHLLVGGSDSFSCRAGVLVLLSDSEARLMKNGTLLVQFKSNNTEDSKELYEYGDFCLGHTGSEDSGFQLEYVLCEAVPGAAERFNSAFYPAALFLSAFFFLITILFYVTILDISGVLFLRITLCFLVNAFICYIFLAVKWLVEDHIKGTPACAFIGYVIQHTFIGLFSWITAMTIKITKMSTQMLRARSSQRPNINRNFLYYFLGFQGLPCVVSIVTALLDAYGNCDWILPNMGRYTCAPDNQYDEERIFGHSRLFLYIHLIILVLHIINIICFIITVYYLVKHWAQMSTVQRSNAVAASPRAYTFIIIKIGIMMGLPWALEVISSYIAYKYSDNRGATLALDIVNLFTGAIVFLVLVCQRSNLQAAIMKVTILRNNFSHILPAVPLTGSSYLEQEMK